MTLPAAVMLMNAEGDSVVAGVKRDLKATACSSANIFAVFTRHAAAYTPWPISQ
jgi:hypothetical protein